MDLVAPHHVGSSWIRGWTHDCCICMWISYPLSHQGSSRSFLWPPSPLCFVSSSLPRPLPCWNLIIWVSIPSHSVGDTLITFGVFSHCRQHPLSNRPQQPCGHQSWLLTLLFSIVCFIICNFPSMVKGNWIFKWRLWTCTKYKNHVPKEFRKLPEWWGIIGPRLRIE